MRKSAMYKDFRKLLHNAHGVSGFVIALFLDVRGFSSFAKLAESSEAAIFLRRVYIKIMDEFFAEAAFFKPTGDGLMVIMPYDEHNLEEQLAASIGTSLRLISEFPSLCDDDPMVNFDVLPDLGIGLARGASTCLLSGRTILDYSGRPLNLAARLMDLARPKGVVFDESLGARLLPDDLRDQFASEQVYITELRGSW
jgi:class 3 adenylate cyclase